MSTIWAAAVPYPASTNDTTMTSSLPTCTSMRRSLANGARSWHHERAEVAVAMEHAHRAARAGAPRLGGREVDHPARIDEDAVILPGRVDGHEAAHDVAADALERTIEGMAPAAAAARRQPEHVAPAQDVAVGHRGQPPLVGTARVDHALARPARLTTVHTGGWKPDVVLTDCHDRLGGRQLDIADHAGAAAVASRPARVLVQRVAAPAQGKHHLHELGGVVFLGHVIDAVEAVGERPRAIAHGDGAAAPTELVARAVEAAEEVDVVDRVRRGNVAARGQGQEGQDVRMHARRRVS